MATEQADRPPLMQRLYDRIWILAALSLVFFYVTYLLWGLSDWAAVPAG